MDDEYVRNGVASFFLEVEPLGGKCKVKMTDRRTRIDWAHFIKEMLEERYADAERVVLVMDNSDTPDIASLSRSFRRRKPGVWLSALRYTILPSMEVG